jgi:arsenate reductase
VDYIHWSIDDPAPVEGTEEVRLKAFRKARDELRQRITLFLLANRIGSLSGSRPR